MRRSRPRLRLIRKEGNVVELSNLGTAEPGEQFFAAIARFDAPHHVVQLSGELDLATRDTAVGVCTAAEHQHVVIDLSGLTFMDCAGYGGLAAAASILERRGGSSTLIQATGEPKRLLRLIERLERSQPTRRDLGTDPLHSRKCAS